MAYDTIPRLEIRAGTDGFYNTLTSKGLPLGAAAVLRNATLGDRVWRTGGGAAKKGTAYGQAAKVAIDYWPVTTQQRTVVVFADGTIQKDDGTGANWAQLASGLSLVGAHPHLSMAGFETASLKKKLFYCDGVHGPQSLAGDGAAMANISSPAADWSGTNQPLWMASHQSFNWGGGNPNAPHRLYRSMAADHGNFHDGSAAGDGLGFTLMCGPMDLQEYLVGGITYFGGLLVFAFPRGVYFVDTTTDPNQNNWDPAAVAEISTAGPRCFCRVEGDVIYVATDGSWHSLSSVFGQQKASIRAADITYKKLTNWGTANIALDQLVDAELRYYDARQELILAYAPIGTTLKTARLHADLSQLAGGRGPNWLTWDRDNNYAFFLRKHAGAGGRLVPAMLDDTGQLWELDQDSRDKAGGAYTFECQTMDTDFGDQYPTWKGRLKNAYYVQVEYLANGTFSGTLTVYMDGTQTQQTSVSFAGSGAPTLPVALPVTLGAPAMVTTPYIPLTGQFKRIAFDLTVSAPDADLAVTAFYVGAQLAGD